MSLIHLYFFCYTWMCSCLTPIQRTWPFYLHPEYFISPSISLLGLLIYVKSLASTYAQATSNKSPVIASPQRSYDRKVLSLFDLSAFESDWVNFAFFYSWFFILFIGSNLEWLWAQSAISMTIIYFPFVTNFTMIGPKLIPRWLVIKSVAPYKTCYWGVKPPCSWIEWQHDIAFVILAPEVASNFKLWWFALLFVLKLLCLFLCSLPL